MQEMFIHAEEVRELLGISRSKAYGIVRQLNGYQELSSS